MVLRNGWRGKFYGCSKFPECKGTESITPLTMPDDYLVKSKPAPEPATQLTLDERRILVRICKFRLKDGRIILEVLNEELRTKATQILGNEL